MGLSEVGAAAMVEVPGNIEAVAVGTFQLVLQEVPPQVGTTSSLPTSTKDTMIGVPQATGTIVNVSLTGVVNQTSPIVIADRLAKLLPFQKFCLDRIMSGFLKLGSLCFLRAMLKTSQLAMTTAITELLRTHQGNV